MEYVYSFQQLLSPDYSSGSNPTHVVYQPPNYLVCMLSPDQSIHNTGSNFYLKLFGTTTEYFSGSLTMPPQDQKSHNLETNHPVPQLKADCGSRLTVAHPLSVAAFPNPPEVVSKTAHSRKMRFAQISHEV